MTLPVIYLNHLGPTPDEFEFLDNMQAYPPKTSFKPGDLGMIRRRYISGSHEAFPKIWQVRFVVSKYQYQMHEIIHRYPGIGFDHAHDFLPFDDRLFCDPMVYAHAFPHGIYPNTCHWFEGFELKRMMLRAPTEDWEPILDEFETPFLGVDTSGLGASFHLDLAPDRYDIAARRKNPLSFEEGAFHSACLVGLEETMVLPSISDDEFWWDENDLIITP